MLSSNMCCPSMENAVPSILETNNQMHKEWARKSKPQYLLPSSKTQSLLKKKKTN